MHREEISNCGLFLFMTNFEPLLILLNFLKASSSSNFSHPAIHSVDRDNLWQEPEAPWGLLLYVSDYLVPKLGDVLQNIGVVHTIARTFIIG